MFLGQNLSIKQHRKSYVAEEKYMTHAKKNK